MNKILLFIILLTTPCYAQISVGLLNDGVAVDDVATGKGFLMYTEELAKDRFVNIYGSNASNVVAVRYNFNKW